MKLNHYAYRSFGGHWYTFPNPSWKCAMWNHLSQFYTAITFIYYFKISINLNVWKWASSVSDYMMILWTLDLRFKKMITFCLHQSVWSRNQLVQKSELDVMGRVFFFFYILLSPLAYLAVSWVCIPLLVYFKHGVRAALTPNVLTESLIDHCHLLALVAVALNLRPVSTLHRVSLDDRSPKNYFMMCDFCLKQHNQAENHTIWV